MISTESMSKVLHNVEREITAPTLSRSVWPELRRDRDDNIDPIILGLLTHLPQAGDVWPEEKRKLWLSLLEGGFKLIYQEAAASAS